MCAHARWQVNNVESEISELSWFVFRILSREQLELALNALWMRQTSTSHLLLNSLHLIMVSILSYLTFLYLILFMQMCDLTLSAESLHNVLSNLQQSLSSVLDEVLLCHPKHLRWVFSEKCIAESCGMQAVSSNCSLSVVVLINWLTGDERVEWRICGGVGGNLARHRAWQPTVR